MNNFLLDKGVETKTPWSTSVLIGIVRRLKRSMHYGRRDQNLAGKGDGRGGGGGGEGRGGVGAHVSLGDIDHLSLIAALTMKVGNEVGFFFFKLVIMIRLR